MEKLFRWLGNIFSTILLGDLKQKIATKDDIKPLNKAIQSLNHAVIEIQDFIKDSAQKTFEHRIEPFGFATSPIVLKNDFRHFVEKSDIAKQVKKKEKKLIKYLKDKKPETGLDAQKEINTLVTSAEIEKFIDLKNYKQYVYEHGKDSGAAMAILAVYLYETIIPSVIRETKK